MLQRAGAENWIFRRAVVPGGPSPPLNHITVYNCSFKSSFRVLSQSLVKVPKKTQSTMQDNRCSFVPMQLNVNNTIHSRFLKWVSVIIGIRCIIPNCDCTPADYAFVLKSQSRKLLQLTTNERKARTHWRWSNNSPENIDRVNQCHRKDIHDTCRLCMHIAHRLSRPVTMTNRYYTEEVNGAGFHSNVASCIIVITCQLLFISLKFNMGFFGSGDIKFWLGHYYCHNIIVRSGRRCNFRPPACSYVSALKKKTVSC